MNKAKNITKNRLEDISTYLSGDKYLEEIAKDEFQCSETCDAILVLCSYKENNIPSPYFKTKKTSNHIKNCENVNELLNIQISDINEKTSGISAYNKILEKYEKINENSDFQFVRKESNSYKEITIKNKNTLNSKAIKKRKYLVVECDEDTEIKENITYIAYLNASIQIPESKYDSKKHWININTPNFETGIGIEISQKGKNIIQKNPTSSIVFICTKISKSQNESGTSRRYSSFQNRKIFYLVEKKFAYKE